MTNLISFLSDCFRRSEASCFWSVLGWPSAWRRSCLQKDPFEGWGCSRQECSDQLLGIKKLLILYYVFIFPRCYFIAANVFPWTFRVWTSLLISWDRLSGNGNHLLRPMLMSRPLTITLWGCSALPSLRSGSTNRRGHVMHNQARSVR